MNIKNQRSFSVVLLLLIITSLFSCIPHRNLDAVESFILDSLDGTETLANANEVFLFGIDGDLKKPGINKPGVGTKETMVQAYRFARTGVTFEELFGSFEMELDSLCLTQAQIKNFCKKNSNWLLRKGSATFFLFKSSGQFFIAVVSGRSGNLLVDVRSFKSNDIWSVAFVEHIVVQQINN